MKKFSQNLKKYGYLALIAAAFPIMLGSGILIRLAIAYHQAPRPQAILTLGGDPKRSELTAQLAQKNPSPKKTRRHGDTGTRRVPVRRATRAMRRPRAWMSKGLKPRPILWMGRLELGGVSILVQFLSPCLPLPASPRPWIDIWVSSGVRPEKAEAIFQSAGIPLNRVHLDYEALDTVSNFTTMVDEFERRNIRHVYIVTSDFHMPRAKGIATFILGSQGIAFTPVSMPTQRPPEPKLFTLLDMGRSIIWLVTGYSGANLNRYFSYDQLTQYFSSSNPAFFAKSDSSGKYWKQGLTARAIPCCKQSRYYESAINSSDN